MLFRGKTVLVTGGTGSFGRRFVRRALEDHPKKIIVFSRDEYKQSTMASELQRDNTPIRFFLGDIRDSKRLYRAFDGVDFVVHAAALKQDPALEYNPFEAVRTNIIGAENIVNAAIDRGVCKVVALSTDKAVNPVNLYGATKLAMEKIFIAANVYAGARSTSFSIVRYGNVVGSRGSVIPFFRELINNGAKELPITDERMTRFWIKYSECIDLVLLALEKAKGGEVFVPKIPSMRIVDLANAMCPACTLKSIGIRPGEKIHETLISEDEARTCIEDESYFRIAPQFDFRGEPLGKKERQSHVDASFVYRSDRNPDWLNVDEIRHMLSEL